MSRARDEVLGSRTLTASLECAAGVFVVDNSWSDAALLLHLFAERSLHSAAIGLKLLSTTVSASVSVES